MAGIARLREFVVAMTHLAERHGADEPRMLDEGERLLQGLIAKDDWLPDEFAAPSKDSSRGSGSGFAASSGARSQSE